jgi:hypothetical protein
MKKFRNSRKKINKMIIKKNFFDSFIFKSLNYFEK